MTTFIVSDMTCDGCVRAITNAVKGAAPDAVVRADLATKVVEITGEASPEVLAEAMRDAGFTPERRAA